MRTLGLLTALLLLASKAPAETQQESADQLPAQNQPVGKDEDQLGDEDLLGNEDRDLGKAENQDLLGDEEGNVAISFTGGERLARQSSVVGTALTILNRCYCQRPDRCPGTVLNKVLGRLSGVCRIFRRRYRLCCR